MSTTDSRGSSSSPGRRSRVARASRLFDRKWIWLWPALAIVVHCLIGWELHSRMEAAVKTTMAGQLHAILDADVAALRLWLHAQRTSAQAAADGRKVVQLAETLIERSGEPATSALALAAAPEAAELRAALVPVMRLHDYFDFLVADRKRTVVAASQDDLIGKDVLVDQAEAIDRVLAGESIVAPPFQSDVLLADEKGRLRAHLPTVVWNAASGG
ncbi:MAG TPA: hypothetical protein VNH11_19400 [Pirellulales bacterium]|nr:hypothetical protein [Pirellulales bacterium]